jgi:putative CocE/NonD family hydrolase
MLTTPGFRRPGRRRRVVTGFALAALSVGVLPASTALTAGAAVAESQTTCEVVYAPMRDGVQLATEVYMPEGPGPHPVVLQRTPYNRTVASQGANCDNPSMEYFAESGYVALNQDVRGRYRSEGDFDPMTQEAADSYDSIEWAAEQSWSTGKVGMVGGSYVGLTQWQGAIGTPPHLAAMVPHYTASDYHNNWTYVDGVFDLWFAQSWSLGALGVENYRRSLLANGVPQDEAEERASEWYNDGRENILSDWVWQLPLDSLDAFDDGQAPWYYEWLEHPTYDEHWASMDLENKYGQVEVPVLNSGGWYDIFQVGTVRNFQGMQRDGGTTTAREGSRLVMRSLAHAPAPGTPSTTAGEVDFGPNNAFDLNAASVRFFDYYLKGIDNDAQNDPAVEIFVMVPPDEGTEGDGFWVTGETFPLEGTEEQTWRIGSGGKANSSSGDGLLGPAAESDTAKSDSFIYDPKNPVPTVGGNLCCDGSLLPPGSFEQSQVEERDDVLVYTSPPLEEDLTVIGGASVELFARTSGRDTDFTAKLVDVHPDGDAYNVLDRVVRASLRNGSKQEPQPIKPGQIYRYDIELGNTAIVFPAGHRIRLEISSSNFPHYARNLNTGDSSASASKMRKARQTIVHTDRYPSALTLPVNQAIEQP